MTLSEGLRDREYGKFVEVNGSPAIRALIIGSITIGSVSANVDSVYIQSGDNINLGTSWTDVGSVYVMNTVVATTGSESWVKNFSDLGSSVVVENFTDLGSSVVVTNFADLGSSVMIENFTDLGSSVVVSNFTDLGSVVVSKRADVSYTKISKTADRTTAGSTAIWVPENGKKAIITDMIVSNGSPAANTVEISSAGSVFAKAVLGEYGGFVSNLQTPVETQTNGSVWFVTSATSDNTSATLTGFEI